MLFPQCSVSSSSGSLQRLQTKTHKTTPSKEAHRNTKKNKKHIVSPQAPLHNLYQSDNIDTSVATCGDLVMGTAPLLMFSEEQMSQQTYQRALEVTPKTNQTKSTSLGSAP